MLALVNHVFIKSANNPSAKIKNICLNESGSAVIIKNEGNTATMAVVVIKLPVLNAL